MVKQARWVLAITAVLLMGMLWWHNSTRNSVPVQVQTSAVTVRDIYNSVTMSGEIEAADTTALCPATDAVVSAVYVSVGDTVEQGDILCALRPVTAAATAALTDSVQAAWDALSEGQAQSVQAEESSVLRAPMTGAVLSLPAEGEYVYTNVPCVRMADLENLQVRAQCPELYAAQLASGQQANVTVSALSDEVYGATLQSLAPVATRAVSLTGNSGEPTVEALLTLSGDTEGLRPGYSATVKVFTDRHTAAMAVPYEAVCQRGEQEYVFCMRDGRAAACPVETGYMLASSVEICSGIEPDDIVILSPADTLADGAPVEVTAWG